MREYIIYVTLIFIPIGMIMAYLLHREGIAKRNIVIIVSVSALIIVSFPVSMERMGTFISLLSYIVVILVMTRYLLGTREEYSLRAKGTLVTGSELEQLLVDLEKNGYDTSPVLEAGNFIKDTPISLNSAYDSVVSYSEINLPEDQNQPFEMVAEQEQETFEDSKEISAENQEDQIKNEPEEIPQDLLDIEVPAKYTEVQAETNIELSEEVFEREELRAEKTEAVEVIEAAVPEIEAPVSTVEIETEELWKQEDYELTHMEEESLDLEQNETTIPPAEATAPEIEVLQEEITGIEVFEAMEETEKIESIDTETVVLPEPEDLQIIDEVDEAEAEQLIENEEQVTEEEDIQEGILEDSSSEESLSEQIAQTEASEDWENVIAQEIPDQEDLILDRLEEGIDHHEWADVVDLEAAVQATGEIRDVDDIAQLEEGMEIDLSSWQENEGQPSVEEPAAVEAEEIETSETFEPEAGVDELIEEDAEDEVEDENEEYALEIIETVLPEETEIISVEVAPVLPEEMQAGRNDEKQMESVLAEEPVELSAEEMEVIDVVLSEPSVAVDLQAEPLEADDITFAPEESPREEGDGGWLEAESGENITSDFHEEAAAVQEEEEPAETQEFETIEQDNEISVIDSDLNNARIIDLIDQGFLFKDQHNWPEAARCFESAWELTGDAELKYLIGVELTAIYESLPATL